MQNEPRHFVAVVGGAVSGSVAAEILADAGAEVVVIEMNDRPYGKIEDGLPRWHSHQRKKEYEKIDARLSKEKIHFLPRTKLGKDVGFSDLVERWGLSAVLLANGAWRDRPLGLPGCEDYVGKGLEYQNPFIYWFNHKEEEGFRGRSIDVPDGAVIFGGGLASIDVVKVCQLEIYGRALKQRGIDVPMIEMEKQGIPATCQAHGIDPTSLGLKGALLVYRRRKQDMPLAQAGAKAPDELEKAYAAREKLLAISQGKFLFRFQDTTMPIELVTKGGRVTGVKVVRTAVEGRKATPIPGSEEVIPTGLVISSIGSIPEPIEGIRMKGETFDFKDWDMGVYDAQKGIFGVGNVVTGQGNIRASLLHAQKVAAYLNENYFAGAVGAAGAEVVQGHLAKRAPLPATKLAEIRKRVKALQEKAGYGGDYHAWIKKVMPPDLH
ncbi:MAG TPA: NAD(P)-binding protein [Planctomycetota bacterium]|nr:NAD(P)-binding protein [Planctomycetota bacterium]